MNFSNRIPIYIIRFTEVTMQLLVFLAFLLFFLFGFVQAKDTRVLPCLLFLLLPVTALYIARLYIQKGAILFLVHICVGVYMYFLGDSMIEKTGFFFTGAILIFYSLYQSSRETKESAENVSIVFLGFFIFNCLVGSYQSSDTLIQAGLVSGELFLILKLLHYNFCNVNSFIMLHKESAALPVKQLITINSFMMTVFITLCSGLMLLFGNTYVGQILQSLGNLLRNALIAFLRFLFSGLWKEYPETLDTETPPETSTMMPFAEDNIPDSLWRDILYALERIIGIIVVIALVIALVTLLVTSFLKLIKNMSSTSLPGDDISEFIFPKDLNGERFRKKRRQTIPKGANAKARRLYKSMVTKNAAKADDTIQPSMLPRDISKQYYPGDAKRATEIYEKARYSDGQVTKEELQFLKKNP